MMSKKVGFSLVGLVIVGVMLLATYSISVVGAQQQAPTKEQLEEILEFFKEQGNEEGIKIMEEVLAGKRGLELKHHFTPRQPYRGEWPHPRICLNLFGIEAVGCYVKFQDEYDRDQVHFSEPRKPYSIEDLCIPNNTVALHTEQGVLDTELGEGPGWYLYVACFEADPFDSFVDVKIVFQREPDSYWWEGPIIRRQGRFCYPLLRYMDETDIANKCQLYHLLLPTESVWFPAESDESSYYHYYWLFYVGP